MPPEDAYAAFKDASDEILAYAEDAAILPHPAPNKTPGAIVLMVLVAGIVALAVGGRRRR